MLKLYNKIKALNSIIRGIIIKFLFLPKNNGAKLRVGKNVTIRGDINIGKGVIIESNVKIYNHTKIGNNVTLGDNVELRSNKPSFVSIGDRTSINRNSLIMGVVSIGEDCSIAPGCIVVGSNHVFDDCNTKIKMQGLSRKGIVIENNVWLGANVVVLDGVNIGEGCVIGAGAVVTKSIPANSIAVGNPCRILKSRI